MPQPNNISQIEAARAKQLDARRKMQALPSQQQLRTELPNINWHDYYLQRVAK
jgi:hypothetical protein